MLCVCELRTQQSLSVASISTPPAKAGRCVQFVSHGRVFERTVFAPGLQQHFAQVGEVIYAAIFTVRGTGKPRGRDQNES